MRQRDRVLPLNAEIVMLVELFAGLGSREVVRGDEDLMSSRNHYRAMIQ